MADKNDGSDKHWSSFYDEEEDNFDEFKRFEVTEDAPARQMSGSVVEEEAAKDWEEDWEDEVPFRVSV